MFSTKFLDAVGRWLRGWRQNPVLRAPIAAQLEHHASQLPSRFREHDGSPVYRKRSLYSRDDQQELIPLFLLGELDEGSVTSWSLDPTFFEKFGDKFDHVAPNAAAGAIFRHVPRSEEVILNIPALWADADFVRAAHAYKACGGAEADALFWYAGDRDQSELILRAPLRLDEIYLIHRPGDIDSLSQAAGAETADQKQDLLDALFAAGIDLRDPGYRSTKVTQQIVQRVAAGMRQRLAARAAIMVPFLPDGRRGRLIDAFKLGDAAASADARFVGWRRLPSRESIMEARWSDGTVAYHRRDGCIWLCPRAPFDRVVGMVL